MSKFSCTKCAYKTDHKSSFDKHLKSKKHYKSTLKCFDCQKQYQKPAMYNKHNCTKINGNENIAGNENMNNTNSPNAMNILGDYNSGKIYHINVHNYKGDLRKIIWQLTSDNTQCFDSPEFIELVNEEFDKLHATFIEALECMKQINKEMNNDYYRKFMSHVYKLPYEGYTKKEIIEETINDGYESEPYEDDICEEEYYKLTDDDYEKMRDYTRIINDFDNIVCYAYDEHVPKSVLQPRLYSYRNLKLIMIRSAPELVSPEDMNNITLDTMNGDKNHNINVASNLINNLAVRAIYRVICNKKKPSQRNMVSAEENIFFKSKFNSDKDLQQLTFKVISVVFNNLQSILDDANNAFPDVHFSEKHVNIDYIKEKIAEFVYDITP